MTLRLFTAIDIPDEVAARLEPLQRDVPGARWRKRENFHLTLQFLGDLSEPVARELDEELALIRLAPFEVSLSGVGFFGRREPTSLWAGVAPCPELEGLAAKIGRTARRLGVEMESRKYTPHVTLAYCQNTMLEEAAAFQQMYSDFRTEPFWVEQYALYSSHRTKSQSRYDEEATYPLGGN